MHLTLGILPQSQAVFYALAFFQLDGFAVPAPAQVTQTVRRFAQIKTRLELQRTDSLIVRDKIRIGRMDKESPSIRLAVENDVDEIFSFEYIAQQNESRQTFIRHSVATKSCYVASYKQIVGYAVLEYSFYEMGFVSMLYVHSDWQRHGIGTKLLKHFESICLTDRLFTSTNLSNVQMQALLAKLGYKLSGVIHDLDEDDPELVYVKYLQQTILVN